MKAWESWQPLRSRRLAVVAMVLAAASAALFGALEVHRHHELIRISYELSELGDRARAAEEENRRLRLERSLLTSPERIEAMAGELGMIRPAPGQIRRVPREVATR